MTSPAEHIAPIDSYPNDMAKIFAIGWFVVNQVPLDENSNLYRWRTPPEVTPQLEVVVGVHPRPEPNQQLRPTQMADVILYLDHGTDDEISAVVTLGRTALVEADPFLGLFFGSFRRYQLLATNALADEPPPAATEKKT